MSRADFKQKLRKLINCESMENGSSTPDYILTDYLMACLDSYNAAVNERSRWYGYPANLTEHLAEKYPDGPQPVPLCSPEVASVEVPDGEGTGTNLSARQGEKG